MRISTNKESLFSLIILVFFSAGFIFHLIPFTRKLVLPLTDISILVSNILVMYFVLQKQDNNKLFYWSVLTFVLTFLTELFGVRSGLIFGVYHYGDTMFLKLFDIPVVIGMNWVILMLGSYSLVQLTGIRQVYVPVLSSVLIVGFDFIMENVAIKLDYWQWEGNHIPLQNFIAWFFISLLFSSILSFLKVSVKSKILISYFLVQLAFFTGLRLFFIIE
ncbi:MAG: carotenoid biosynthesis protein [Bacteroidales bacterium]|nr:carotenoid biosynthesis protein [Bacteroidales bacterium]